MNTPPPLHDDDDDDVLSGSDDSALTRSDFEASWVLMVISGIFSTLGDDELCMHAYYAMLLH